MGLSLVRCPFCDRRYNVTGIPPGTRVLCTSCRTVLTVPGNRFVAPPPFWHRFVPRSGAAQAASALCGGLLLAAVSFIALKEAQSPPVVPSPVSEVASGHAREPFAGAALPILRISDNLRDFIGPFLHDTRYQVHTSPKIDPFVLVVERTDRAEISRIIREFEDLLPKLERTFMKEFGAALRLSRIGSPELPIVVYTQRESYDAWWTGVYTSQPIPGVEGVFSYLERRVSLYYDLDREASDPGRTREVVLHEAIHQLVDHYTRRRTGESDRRGAWWFQEGLGNYFEGFIAGSGGLELELGGRTSRLPLAHHLVTMPEPNSEYVDIRMLMSWDVEAIWKTWLEKGTEQDRDQQSRKLECAYAQSWALVHFLCHAEEGKYRALFLDYFKSELEGKGNVDEFKRLLSIHHTGLDLQKLQIEFKKYVEGM